MLRFAKVETPLTALTLSVPESVPLPGLVPIATVIELVAFAIVFPKGSSIVTLTDGEIDAPATRCFGCVVKTSCDAGAVVMLNVALVPESAGPVDEAARV